MQQKVVRVDVILAGFTCVVKEKKATIDIADGHGTYTKGVDDVVSTCCTRGGAVEKGDVCVWSARILHYKIFTGIA